MDSKYPRLNFEYFNGRLWHAPIMSKKWIYQKSSRSIITRNLILGNVALSKFLSSLVVWELCVCQDCCKHKFVPFSIFLCTVSRKLLVRKYDARQFWKFSLDKFENSRATQGMKNYGSGMRPLYVVWYIKGNTMFDYNT